MKRHSLYLIAVLLCAASVFAREFVPHEVLVKLTSIPRRMRQAHVSVSGVERIDSLIHSNEVDVSLPFSAFRENLPELAHYLLLRFSEEVDIDEEIHRIEQQAGVEWADYNHIFRTRFVPNDSGFSSQWQLTRIQAPYAWDISQGDSSIIIGIIDTGIDYNHPDLVQNLWHNSEEIPGNDIDDDDNGFVDDTIGWDFVDAPSLPAGGDDLTRDNDPMDEYGHGTFVAGVAAATTNNEIGVASIGFHCRIMCLRAGNRHGWLEEDDVAAALLYAMDNGASVVNMSFGDVAASPLLRETARLVHDAGVVLVASAGNSGSGAIHYPSGYSEVISVGWSTWNDTRANGSNYGPWVDVFAPGEDFLSTELGGTVGIWGGWNQGTSYAAPLVAGLVGLILDVNPQMTPEQVLHLLRQTSDDLYPAGWDSSTTHGRINARRALENAVVASGVIARIISPETDDGFNEPFEVIGTAAGPALRRWELLAGIGENPQTWQMVSEGNERIIEGFLGEVVVPDEDTVVVVRLEVEATDRSKSIDHIHLFIDHTPPEILEMSVQKMIDADHFGEMIRIKTDDVTSATLILTNAYGDSVRKDFGYVSSSHTAFLSQREFPGSWNYRVLCKNRAGLFVWTDERVFLVNDPPFVSNYWPIQTTSLTEGHLLRKSSDFDNDGRPEVFMNQFVNGAFDTLRIFEWTGSDFAVVAGVSYGLMIPQDSVDYDLDGLSEMLGRAYGITYLFEQRVPGHFPDSLIWRDTTGFYSFGIFDFDPDDERTELLASRSFDGDLRYGLFRMDPGPNPVFLDTLPNPTDPDTTDEPTDFNKLSSPHVLVGDFDADGKPDFLYGDYDGDVIFCELEPDWHITAPWHVRLPFGDATQWLAAGDVNGDGLDEFIVGNRFSGEGTTESQALARHWEFFVFHRVADDSFAAVDTIFILGAEDPGKHPAAVAAGDLDGDGRDEFLISAFPDLYIIDYDDDDSLNTEYVPVAYFSPCEGNVIFVSEWNRNGLAEFLFCDGQNWQRGEAVAGIGMRPFPPMGLESEPLGPHEVSLRWEPVAGADFYHVWKGEISYDLDVYQQTSDTTVVILDLPEDIEYVYAITSIDSDYAESESAFSVFVTAIANQAPTVVHEAGFVAPHFVRLEFSEAMGPSIFEQRSYRLDDERMPRTITPTEGQRVALLEFEGGLSPRRYRMELSGLRDAQNSLLPPDSGWVEFTVEEETQMGPYIKSLKVLAPTLLELGYSEPMSESVLDTANYRMTPVGKVVSIEAVTWGRRLIRLFLDERWPVGAVGRTSYLHVTNIYSAEGVALDSVYGSATIESVAQTLDDVYIYPNPYKGVGANGTSCVMFAGLTLDATVYIFTLQGRLVNKLEGVNSAGGLPWCLDNENGDNVASGIYLYAVKDNSQTCRGKLAILR